MARKPLTPTPSYVEEARAAQANYERGRYAGVEAAAARLETLAYFPRVSPAERDRLLDLAADIRGLK